MLAGPGAFWLGEDEIKQVTEVIETGHLFRYGSMDDENFKHKVYTLEKEFAKYCGVEYALVNNSGTASLLICLLALGIEPGDEVIVPAYTFVATYTSTIFAHAVPVLTEIDDSLTIDPNGIEARITKKTKAIMPVHMLGNPCNMDAVMDIAEKHGLPVIEDACQAGGASYKKRKVGSIGKMAAFSLNIFKTITAGDGGVITTDDKELYERAFGIHDQGHSPNRMAVEVGRRNILGLNFRVSELIGAVALAQLRKIDPIIKTLREKKNKLKQMIADIPGIKFRKLNDKQGECGTLCTIIFDSADKAAKVAEKLNTTTVDHSGWHVYANMEHVNRHLQKIGQPHGKGAYPRTDDILSRSINISVGVVDPGLGSAFGININSTDSQIETVAEKIKNACASL